MTGIALATEKLGFVYPDGTRSLSGVTLSIAAGERVAIVWPPPSVAPATLSSSTC